MDQYPGTFSIVIPAFNAAAHLRATLASISQARGLQALDAVVVVNDASTDQTAAIARSALAEFGLPGWVISNPSNVGASESRRRACDEVSSPFVFFLDADDLVRPHRFDETMVVFKSESIHLVGGDLQPFGVGVSRPRIHYERVCLPRSGEGIAAAGLFFCPVWGGVSAFRKSLLSQVALPHAAIGEDWLFAMNTIKALGTGAVANTGTVLVDHRRSPGQLTAISVTDCRAVMPIWDQVLRQALGIQATPDELALHAKFSPYHFAETQRPTFAQLDAWLRWADKLQGAAARTNFAPSSVAMRLQLINSDLRSLARENGPAMAL